MRIGYYIAKSGEFRGNCIRLAGKAQLLWEHKHLGLTYDPRPFEGARLVEFDDGTTLKQLLKQDDSDEVQFVDVD